MDRSNRPLGREKNVTGGGAGVHRRGSGLGTGPVGGGSAFGGGNNGGPKRSGGGRGIGGIGLIGVIIMLLLGRGGGFLGGGGGSGTATQPTYAAPTQSTQSQSSGYGSSGSSYGSGGSSGSSMQSYLEALMGGSSYGSLPSGSSSAGWADTSNTGKLNRDVAPEARMKFTDIIGNGKDKVTIMVYMCGTDLESRSGMATNDLAEMAKATIADNVNIIVFTGGCKSWRNNIVSNRVNEIYQVKGGGLARLESNMGTKAMTDPDNLVTFINYCKKNFPANRNNLIFWDHGGGSLSGYGYDEKNPGSGSMNLSQINSALKKTGMKFDFIGFDACLMATAETAQMLSSYADYLIASEETEPGIGWYYTNWLTELSRDTSMPTLDIGQNIVDDFVSECAKSCRGQKTTLSVVDLAELGETLGDEFAGFFRDTTEMIKDGEYKTVSDARYNAREFAQSTAIDQIDLVHFAKNVGSQAGDDLADTLLSAVKYNRTSSNMTNAYGLSIYFPYRKVSKVDQAIRTSDAIGLDEEYSSCLREFASLELSGQAAGGGTQSPYGSLFGTGSSSGGSYGGSSYGGSSYGGSSYGGSYDSAELIGQLLQGMMGGSFGNLSGYSSGNTDFFSGRSMPEEDTVNYLTDNRFDTGNLKWQENAAGKQVISLPEDQWDLIQGVDLNLYYDDGEGYVDLGLDNIYGWDEDGNLVADMDGSWLSINKQPVAYYHLDTTVDEDGGYTIMGRVPAMLNDERVNLILLFDTENPNGYIAGAQPDYEATETETVARGLTELAAGDKLDFLCDYYRYDGEYQDSYFLGEPMTVTDNMEISNTYVGGDVIGLYRFTDIYNQIYWTPAVPQK